MPHGQIQRSLPSPKQTVTDPSNQNGVQNVLGWCTANPMMNATVNVTCCSTQARKNKVKPWRKCLKSTQDPKIHDEAIFHRQALIAADQFKLMLDNAAKSIAAVLKENVKKVEENFTIQHSFIACVLSLDQKGMAFRTDDEAQWSATGIIFIKFKIWQFGATTDPILRNHMDSCPKNASYCSPQIQNVLITLSINQISIAPISPAYPGSVARHPNQCSTAKSMMQFHNVNRSLGMMVSIGKRPGQNDTSWDISWRWQLKCVRGKSLVWCFLHPISSHLQTHHWVGWWPQSLHDWWE